MKGTYINIFSIGVRVSLEFTGDSSKSERGSQKAKIFPRKIFLKLPCRTGRVVPKEIFSSQKISNEGSHWLLDLKGSDKYLLPTWKNLGSIKNRKNL